MLSYSARRNLFEKGEWVWRIEDDTLVVRDHKGGERRYRLADVISLRLAYTPTQYQTWRHVVVLAFRGGAKLTIANSHTKGVADFEDRSAVYSPFVAELVRKVQVLAPRAAARTGSGPVFYWMSVVILTLLFVALAALFTIAPLDEISGTVWIRIGIIIVLAPVLVLWARKAYPRARKLSDLSPELLPGPAA